MAKIGIIGGGIAGCATALELAKSGHEIIILEGNDDILKGTSARTPGRMGLGYHYFDFETAKLYMKHTVDFMKKYSDCFLGNASDQSYLQNGRYFIVKDSLIDIQELMSTYDKISGEFEKMIKSDPSLDVFHTAHLHKTMSRGEYSQDVNMSKIAFAIETQERLLDWRKFDERIKKEITGNGAISINVNHEITKVEMTSDGKFELSRIQDEVDTEKKIKVDYVVNCSWQNIEFLNEKLGLGDSHFKKEDPQQSTTYRLKLLAEVELPESLQKKHSMFFCVGPHAMFSNLGDGIGRITYAPITNFGTTTESKMPDIFQRWLTNGLNKEESKEYGERIINGVAEYIPAMRDSKLIQVIPGIVKSKGSVELTDPKSPFHKRDYSGVEEQQIGWIDNSSMKLFYCLGNAREVSEIILQQEKAKSNIEIMSDILAEHISERASTKNPQLDISASVRVFKSFFTNHMQRYFDTNILGKEKKTTHHTIERLGETPLGRHQENYQDNEQIKKVQSPLQTYSNMSKEVSKKSMLTEDVKGLFVNLKDSEDPKDIIKALKVKKLLEEGKGPCKST